MEEHLYLYVKYDLKRADKMKNFISPIQHMNPFHV